MLNHVKLSKLSIIQTKGGNILHALKKSDNGFSGFGEAYFSCVEPNEIKAWKRHRTMISNIIVPTGKIKFVLFDSSNESLPSSKEVILSQDNYFRLTIPPMLWLGFQNLSKNTSMLLNISQIEHDPDEIDRLDLHKLKYKWN